MPYTSLLLFPLTLKPQSELYVDGRKIFDEGRLGVLEDPEVEAAAKRFGDLAKLLQHNVIDLS